jgi:Zn-dependent protease
VAGIEIFVHWTFLLLIAWVAYAASSAGPEAVVESILFTVLVFACIVAHELGHAMTARRFGIGTRDITLLPIGGVARLERMPEEPTQELLVALGGPAVTLLLAVGLGAVAWTAWGPAAFLPPRAAADAPQAAQFVQINLVARLAEVNALLLAFNLLPAFPMDGGRVLRALLHYRLDYVQATQIAAAVGQAFAVLMGLVGVLLNGLVLVLIAVFVYFGAREESRSVQLRGLCRGVPVRQAMVSRFRALDPDAPLDTAVSALLSGHQQDFPVTRDHQVIGMLTRSNLIKALEEGRRQARVSEVMRQDCRPVDENAPLEDTFERMRQNGCSTVPVVRGDRLVGIMTLENVGEWLMIQSALRRAQARDQVTDIFLDKRG